MTKLEEKLKEIEGVLAKCGPEAEGSWLLTDWVRVYIRAEFLLAALRKAIEQRNTHLDAGEFTTEIIEDDNNELLAILNGEEKK